MANDEAMSDPRDIKIEKKEVFPAPVVTFTSPAGSVPTPSMTVRFQVRSTSELKAVNERGLTILLVEQNARMALQLAHRGYILEQGRVVGEGSGAHLLADAGVQRAYLGYVGAR